MSRTRFKPVNRCPLRSLTSSGALLALMVIAIPDHAGADSNADPIGGTDVRAEWKEAAVSGGPPPDGIPAIDEPQFESASEAADWLEDEDVVFGVIVNGEVRAYPQRILVWHEIVNDTVGGKNLAVTYCPLTGTAIGFERGDTTFGVSGQLVNSNLIMFDRETESWWPQVAGTGIRGDREGERLAEIPVVWTTFDEWVDVHPEETEVLSLETGHARDYRRDPYGDYNPPSGYYVSDNLMFSVLHEDDRRDRKEVVIGARHQGHAVAFSKDALREHGSLETVVEGTRFLALYDPALDTGYVFRALSAADELRFDDLTDGRYGPEPPAGRDWERINAFDAMWFAWAAFHPETEWVGAG